MSSEIANGLKYFFPDKMIFVFYIKEAVVNVSGRGIGVRKLLHKILEDFENATGGGHERAVGARIMKKDLEKFKERVKELIR